MCKLTVLFVAYFLSYAETATFDQSQSGDLNVQVDLKDIQIIALMKGGKEEYVDYDYAYDYSEMTIKPQNGSSTTSKPLNETATDVASDNATIATTLSIEQVTEPIKNGSSLNVTSGDQAPNVTVDGFTTITTANGTFEVTTLKATTENEKNVTTPLVANSTDCKKGFVLNHKGDCELKLQGTGTGNALLKLVKLSQRLKLKRENRRNQDSST